MRTFLLTIFWITTLGSVIQLLIMASASWIIFSGAYSFIDLDINVFITQYIPMFIGINLGIFGRQICLRSRLTPRAAAAGRPWQP